MIEIIDRVDMSGYLVIANRDESPAPPTHADECSNY